MVKLNKTGSKTTSTKVSRDASSGLFMGVKIADAAVKPVKVRPSEIRDAVRVVIMGDRRKK